MDEYLTKREAAKYLKVSPRTINRWVKEGRIQAYRGPLQLRFKREDLDKALTPLAPLTRLPA
jgi:excisionase family DNA binding protein